YTETFSGDCKSTRMLRNYPVIKVSSVTVGGAAIPSTAWSFDTDDSPPGKPALLTLIGYRFEGQCTVVYDAGFFVADEAHTSDTSVAVDAPYGSWAADGGVTANGIALTNVAANPSAGQYSVADGVYAFGNTGTEVLISYSYVPSVLEEACIELVGERYRYKDRIGHASKSLAGQETVSYSLKSMPDFVRDGLANFKRMVPL
ncbi:MAG: hypothetical protein J0H99_04310, partial [Rhodospirillales bacterium]|nr:hypothetical protein [Rhodospirillales bacterium]